MRTAFWKRLPWASRACATLILIVLASCATPPPTDAPEALQAFREAADPLEPLNRTLYDINADLDHALLGPLGYGYRYAVPRPLRSAVHNVLDNASGPVAFANHLLQGNFCRAADTLLRFLFNTTIGLGGAIDVAEDGGIPAQRTDFGVTLALWDVAAGPYLYLPLIGPTNPRDLGGMGVDLAADPWSWAVHGKVLDGPDWDRLGAQVIDESERWLDRVREIEETSLDPYSVYRSYYRQYRLYRIEKARARDHGVACGDDP